MAHVWPHAGRIDRDEPRLYGVGVGPLRPGLGLDLLTPLGLSSHCTTKDQRSKHRFANYWAISIVALLFPFLNLPISIKSVI